jgi:hypothetical protein
MAIAGNASGSTSVDRTATALFTTTQTAQGSGNSGDLTVGPYTELWIDINITANPQGTNPTIQFQWNRKGADGIYYPVWFSDLITGLPANPTKVSTTLGAGMTWHESFGSTGQLQWVVGGTGTPQYTFTPNVYGK